LAQYHSGGVRAADVRDELRLAFAGEPGDSLGGGGGSVVSPHPGERVQIVAELLGQGSGVRPKGYYILASSRDSPLHIAHKLWIYIQLCGTLICAIQRETANRMGGELIEIGKCVRYKLSSATKLIRRYNPFAK
jgi:hypothetical protein